MKVFYDERMNAEPLGYSPSPSKPKAVVEDWQKRGLRFELMPVRPTDCSELSAVHSREYIKGVFDGTIPNGHGTYDRDLADSCMWTCGSIVTAARYAASMGNGEAVCSPTSGFHHAQYDEGGGFCTFNGLALAAVNLHRDRYRVAILDMDYHYGDGTQDILERLGLRKEIANVCCLSRECIENDMLKMYIEGLKVDVLLYQAGADSHKDDPLGGHYSTSELWRRDEIVFRTCRENNISVVWNLAGGYQKDDAGTIEPVLEIHRNTALVCSMEEKRRDLARDFQAWRRCTIRTAPSRFTTGATDET